LSDPDLFRRTIGVEQKAYTVSDFRRDIRAPYAWPGGYPRYFITHDCEALSFESAKENRRVILEAIRDSDKTGWQIVGCDINWEDTQLRCAHSNKPIQSAYGED
jgi:hypothetical protein